MRNLSLENGKELDFIVELHFFSVGNVKVERAPVVCIEERQEPAWRP